MNCKLIDIPLEKREIVYVVQDSGTRAFLKMEYDKLPENCRKYIEFVERQIGYPITMISNGPGRDDIIFR